MKGAGPIIIHKLSADGKQLMDDGGSAAFNWFIYNYDGPKAK